MSDVRLDDSEQVTVECRNLNIQGHDLLLDSPERRKPGNHQFRRASVHDGNDGFTINYDSYYPGGVTLNGVAAISPLGLRGGIVLPDVIVRGSISYEYYRPHRHLREWPEDAHPWKHRRAPPGPDLSVGSVNAVHVVTR